MSTITLDVICDGLDVDFVKVDAEGAEVRVMDGALDTIARCNPLFFIECHSEDTFNELMKRVARPVLTPTHGSRYIIGRMG